MRLIVLFGLPATGKLSVGQELATLTGYKLFHNHLVVDMLTAVFPFGSPAFVKLREATWLGVFDHACRDGLPGLIFTFAPERTVRRGFIAAMEKIVAERGGETRFIELTCPLDILRTRLDTPSRRRHGKLVEAASFDDLTAQGAFALPMPPPHISIDTSRVAPLQAARQIADFLL